jgi:hypothetical protein
MANNVILTPKVFSKMTLMHLGSSLNVCRNMSKEVTSEFANKAQKVGNTVSVRKPYRFTVSSGLKYDPQPIVDTQTQVKVSQIAQVSFEWDSVERTLSLREASELYAKPAGIALASKINSDAAKFVALNTFNATGTPGSTPSDEQPYLAAGDKLIQLGLPEGEDLNLIINRKFSSTFVHGVKTLFNPTGAISKQWSQGQMVDSFGYRVFRDQSLYTRKVGPLGGSPQVDGANAALLTADGGNNATMNLPTKGWTSGNASRLKPGDRFTIANVNSVHPQTRQSTGDLQQFVVLADFSDASGSGSVTVAPAITPSGQYQNVDAAPIDSATITVDGTANTVTTQGLLMHKNAFAFVSVPLENPVSGRGVEEAEQVTDPETGITISFVRFFDGVNRIHGNRFDVLYDFAPLYREMACVIEG